MTDKNPKAIARMFSSIAPVYDSLNRGMSMWQDIIWRKNLIQGADLPSDGLILDVCTGTGDLGLGFLSERDDFKGNVIAIDFSAKMVDQAREKVAVLGAPFVRRIEFLMDDALNVSFADDKFDLVCVGFGVRNLADTVEGLKEIHRVLKPGAQANILEFFSGGIDALPIRFYTERFVPFIGNTVSKTRAYTYLQRTTRDFYTIHEFEELLDTLGFNDIRRERQTFGICHIVRCRKPN